MNDTTTLTKLLFVCRANLERSPTAADMCAGMRHYDARSAGIDPLATQTLTQELLEWADIVFVMEHYMHDYISEHFRPADTPVYSLEIPDHYTRGHPELEMRIRESLANYIDIS